MTKKVYRTANGKTVDMGALLLQNENVRAVGNMNVNARGDVLDSNNTVIDQKNRQVQRQYQKQSKKATNVSTEKIYSSQKALQRELAAQDESTEVEESPVDIIEEPAPVEEPTLSDAPRGGLAAAIARARTIQQEPEKTLRQRQQEAGIKKI